MSTHAPSLAAFFAAFLAGLSPAQARIAWRHPVDATVFGVRPAVGPNGTVYVTDFARRLRAIRPDGTLEWVIADVGHKGVAVGPDGTIYAGDEAQIVAVRPDGVRRWTFTMPHAFNMLGPSVGPDGNVYAVAEDALGVLSLTPAGTLRWSTPERYTRPMVYTQELVFGLRGGRLQTYFHADGHVAQVDCASGAMTTLAAGGGEQPAVGPNGDVYAVIANELRAIDAGGSERWRFGEVPRNVMSAAAAASDGTVFVVRNAAYLHALRGSDGSSQWMDTTLDALNAPALDPTERVVLVSGRDSAGPGFVRAVSPRGRRLWQLALQQPGADPVNATTRARFTPDGSRAYFGARTLGTTSRYSVIALELAPTPAATRTYGAGCAGSAGTPALSFQGAPVLGSRFTVALATARASSAALLLVGPWPEELALGPLGGGSCRLLTLPAVLVSTAADAQGRADVPVGVPAIPGLEGITLFCQFGVADPANRLGLVTSNGGAATLGR